MKRVKIFYIIIFFFIAYAAYATFTSVKKEWDVEAAKKKRTVQAFPALCETGKWIEISKRRSEEEKFEKEAVLKKNGRIFSDEKEEVRFRTEENVFLNYFKNRRIIVSGSRESEKEVFVNKIKCIGIEADREDQANRQRMMRYVASGINNFSVAQNEYGSWKVTAFYFVNESDFYVEYISDSKENNDEIMLWLVTASKMERAKPILETRAYIRKTEKEREVLKGEDIHEGADADMLFTYKFNNSTNKWTVQ